MRKINLSEKSAFQPQTNGEISNSITKTWTEQAMECYAIGCDCRRCSLSGGSYSFICQMPKVIEVLIEFAGKPAINPL